MLTLTASIREARTHGAIAGRGTSWQVYVPWCASDPSGPSTEMQADSHRKAVALLTRSRAKVALSLAGRLTADSADAIDALMSDPFSRIGHDLRSVVRYAARHA